MRMVADGTQVPTRPAPAVASGTPGWATNGNIAAGQDAGILEADDYNSVLAELKAFLDRRQIQPDPTDDTQVLTSSIVMFTQPWQYATVAGSSSLSRPGWASRLEYWLGGGGAGGGAAGQNGNGGGGGAGERRYGCDTVTAATVAYSLGAGGSGGATPTAQGSGGGDSTLTLSNTLTVTAKGGQGGYGGDATGGTAGAGGLGGSTGSGGGRAAPGDPGQDGGADVQAAAGKGGYSPEGAAGKGTTGAAYSPNATGNCAGGGGSYKGSGTGGNGAPGVLAYRWLP